MRALRVTPTAKPRMTRSDKWKQRPIVVRYREFKDELRAELERAGIVDIAPDGHLAVTFIVPMPKSWSKKQKAEMLGQPHQQTPDVDNLVKALLDATMTDDKHVWGVHAEKWWGREGCIHLHTYTEQAKAA